MYITCSRALCGNEDGIMFTKNLWDCKENQLLTQPQRWLCSECYRQTLLWGWWDITPVSGTGWALWLGSAKVGMCFLWIYSLILILLSYVVETAPRDWAIWLIPLTQRLPPNHISFLIYLPHRLLRLEKILLAATVVKSFDMRPLFLNMWMN